MADGYVVKGEDGREGIYIKTNLFKVVVFPDLTQKKERDKTIKADIVGKGPEHKITEKKSLYLMNLFSVYQKYICF